jgi:hypothetical protein
MAGLKPGLDRGHGPVLRSFGLILSAQRRARTSNLLGVDQVLSHIELAERAPGRTRTFNTEFVVRHDFRFTTGA